MLKRPSKCHPMCEPGDTGSRGTPPANQYLQDSGRLGRFLSIKESSPGEMDVCGPRRPASSHLLPGPPETGLSSHPSFPLFPVSLSRLPYGLLLPFSCDAMQPSGTLFKPT